MGTMGPDGEYVFSKYNKKIQLYRYDDEEYRTLLNDPSWTREETDYLLSMCERFDLRFVVIADRYKVPQLLPAHHTVNHERAFHLPALVSTVRRRRS